MKLSGTTALALAIYATANGASASPLRMLSFGDLPEEFSPDSSPSHRDHHAHHAESEGSYAPFWRWRKPCPKHQHQHQRERHPADRGPLASILSKLGFAPRPHLQPTSHYSVVEIPPPAYAVSRVDIIDETERESRPEQLIYLRKGRILALEKERVTSIEKEEVPISPGGSLHLIPLSENQRARDEEWWRKGWRPKAGRQGHHEHHHHHHHGEAEMFEGPVGAGRRMGRGRMYWRQHRSFGARLSNALHHLSAPEVFALIFVLGVGSGSLLHVGIVMFIVFLRLTRRRGMQGCRERRAARRAAKAERRAAKKAARQVKRQQTEEGKIRLEGSDDVVGHDLPPRYESEEEHVPSSSGEKV